MAPAKTAPKTIKATPVDVGIKASTASARKTAAKPASIPVKKAARKRAASPPAAVPKVAKDKLVRDSFTMPRSDFALIEQLKEKALGFKRPTKKSELLRAGLHALAALSDGKLEAALGALVPLKPGRPKHEGK